MNQMDPKSFLIDVTSVFDKLRIPYLVTGGMAVLIWGRPRFTADIDIVVEITSSDVGGLVKGLKKLGEAGYIDEDVACKTVETGGEFNFIDGVTGIKVDFWVSSNDPFDSSRFKRRVFKKISGHKVYFTSPEDLVLSKLKWYKSSGSNRHLEDAQSVLKISGADLDRSYLKEWALRLGIEDELKKLMSGNEF